VYFPRPSFAGSGPMQAGLLYTVPTTGSTNAERFMALSIASARRTLYIENSYFVPDDDFRHLLAQAVARGVDVRVLTAGPKTDVKTTTWAGRARYEELITAGVRVYEYQPTMLHSKSFVIDGLWSTVGSLNFDNRSLSFNNETNIVVLDRAFGAVMDSSFFADLKYSKEISLPEFRRRAWTEKTAEWVANLFSRFL
jgi:cardiolipin synthase